ATNVSDHGARPWHYKKSRSASVSDQRELTTAPGRGITKNLGPSQLATNVSDHGARPWPPHSAIGSIHNAALRAGRLSWLCAPGCKLPARPRRLTTRTLSRKSPGLWRSLQTAT